MLHKLPRDPNPDLLFVNCPRRISPAKVCALVVPCNRDTFTLSPHCIHKLVLLVMLDKVPGDLVQGMDKYGQVWTSMDKVPGDLVATADQQSVS